MPFFRLWPFALFYFCYYSALGAFTPYVGRWVDSLGHSGYVVGGMLMLWYGSRVLAPAAWNAVIERSTKPGYWLVAGSVLTLLCFAAFTRASAASALFAVMLLFGLFYNALMPQFEAMTLNALGANSHDYGRLRVWGSAGFLLIAGSFGLMLDRLGNAAFPWIALPLFILLVAAAWLHRHDGHSPLTAVDGRTAGSLWRRPGVARFLLMAFLVQAGFGPFYVFFTLHLQAQGHGGGVIGLLWATGIVAEIVLFWRAPRLIARYGASALIQFSLAVSVVRWLITAGFAASVPVMLLAQSSHALGFALFHACCMRLMAEYFPGRDASVGQSLLYSFSSGLGGVAGSAMAAVAWEQGGGMLAFLGAAFVTALAWVLFTSEQRHVTMST